MISFSSGKLTLCCLLDMGLGKTVQVIGLLAAMLRKTGTGQDQIDARLRRSRAQRLLAKRDLLQEQALIRGDFAAPVTTEQVGCANAPAKWAPVLIVMPPSIMQNWVRDIKIWTHLSIATYHGPLRTSALNQIKSGDCEILLCANSMFSQDAGFADILTIPWKIVVIDEFHMHKNEKGRSAINLRCLRSQNECVILGLTGTLMQNNHKELWYVESFYLEALSALLNAFVTNR